MCFNAVDRHLAKSANKVAFFVDSPVTNAKFSVTYGELHANVVAVANVLKHKFGVKKGSCVVIYMPNTIEAVYTMLACARLGAPHSVVFGGFASPELSKRIADSGANTIITTSCGVEGSRVLDYKALVDAAIGMLLDPSQVTHVGVFMRSKLPTVSMTWPRDCIMNESVQTALSRPHAEAECVNVESSHPFYLLYTSGTTGVPKGITRDTAGSCVAMASTIRSVYGIEEDDVIFTASDIGWIVGTNFTVYAPLINGSTSVLYEGKPVGTPNAGAFFRVIQEYSVNALFTAPTAIRAIKAVDPGGVEAAKFKTDSLHGVFLGGERTDPNTMAWLQALLKVPVVDHWWQTETGSPITASPVGADGEIMNRPGSAGVACPGWNLTTKSVVSDASHTHSDHSLACPTQSQRTDELVIKLPLPPGALKCIWGRPEGVRSTYLSHHPGYFCTFDAGEIDSDGFVHVMSRTDDIINTAGHRLSTGQMEGVLCEHASVAEAAVFGVQCAVKGEVPVAAVVLKRGQAVDGAHLEKMVREIVGPIAVVKVYIVNRLPKTRSGKVLRKTLRGIANNKEAAIVFPPTIEDEGAVYEIYEKLHGIPHKSDGERLAPTSDASK
jgi:propionyl-CoA synthetase